LCGSNVGKPDRVIVRKEYDRMINQGEREVALKCQPAFTMEDRESDRMVGNALFYRLDSGLVVVAESTTIICDGGTLCSTMRGIDSRKASGRFLVAITMVYLMFFMTSPF
jgi:hypothetical protein